MNASVTRIIAKPFEPIHERVYVSNRMRKWAAENAYTLVLLSAFFFVTWVMILVVGIIYG